jgi:hypothetical protein
MASSSLSRTLAVRHYWTILDTIVSPVTYTVEVPFGLMIPSLILGQVDLAINHSKETKIDI